MPSVEFREAVTNLQATSVAHRLVPSAFASALDESLAINLFAATVALTFRLGLQAAAGCLAEEIIAVELLTIARGELDAQLGSGLLSADQAEHATDELRGLFELFEDDDVLGLFEMSEPADAALAGHDPGYYRSREGENDDRFHGPN